MRRHQFSIGQFQCTLYRDTNWSYTVQSYFSNIDQEIYRGSLPTEQVSSGMIASPYVALVVEGHGAKVLIDVGLGICSKPIKFQGGEFVYDGSLGQLLREDGHRSSSFSHVILTHFHPDHIGGLSGDLPLVFGDDTRFYCHLDEWDFWHGPKAERMPSLFKDPIQVGVAPLKNQMQFCRADEQTITPGITLLQIAGHTPGQLAVQISSDGEHLLYISDAWLHPLHIENLDWQTQFDLDHGQTKKSRVRLLELAYQENMLVQCFHFPFPGLGRVDRVGNGWKWLLD